MITASAATSRANLVQALASSGSKREIPLSDTSIHYRLLQDRRLGGHWPGLEYGEIVHRTIFGYDNFGNGAYAILQFMENGDLLFNSVGGPFRALLATR